MGGGGCSSVFLGCFYVVEMGSMRVYHLARRRIYAQQHCCVTSLPLQFLALIYVLVLLCNLVQSSLRSFGCVAETQRPMRFLRPALGR